MKYTCERYPQMRIYSGAKSAQFQDGVLETTDKDLQNVLDSHEHVAKVSSGTKKSGKDAKESAEPEKEA